MGRSVRTILAILVAGVLSAYIAIVGDGDGLHVSEASRFASGYVPYVVIVLLLGGTAPSVLHAVLRASGSQLIMVWGYYTWGPMTNFEQTPTKATNLAMVWSGIALTAVPVAALAAFAGGSALRGAVRARRAGSGTAPARPGHLPVSLAPPPVRAAGAAPDAPDWPDPPGPPDSRCDSSEVDQGTSRSRRGHTSPT